ncbi:LLM class flavin-dependent oxidoreductase [Streptomyces arenae]|uniref:LLM class flavin-dependent oxidoreductase n=1 Tax=Streptomyces arenae TaxID=29301 RepID=UPI00265B716F|nr:LLM class flavin-dependent oxidoreductase [Streptomyces arenae]MCG7209792.1 LLM class flavin-dependent oxidoreductase [Streptomyces arenae]
MTDIDIGVMLPASPAPGEAPGKLVAAARCAEELGFESVWTGDQLIVGSGLPLLDSLTSLTAAAAVTERVRLGVGVLILPLRQPVWVAKQVASIQHISGDRMLLGVGAGNDYHHQSWAAAGVSQRDRGRLTDESLRLLPDLIAGNPVRLGAEATPIQLSPPATVPPVIVGGMSDAALRRAASVGDGWYTLDPPDRLPGARARLEELAAVNGRPVPAITTMARVAIQGDLSLPGIPADEADATVVTGEPALIAEHLSDIAARGAQRVVVMFTAGDWFRQAELLAEASRLR